MATSPKKATLPIRSADEILQTDDLSEKVIEVPEWETAIKVRQLSRAQFKELAESATNGDDFDEGLWEVYLFCEAVVEPEFTRDRATQLANKNAMVLNRVILEIIEHNKIGGGALETALAGFPD